MFIYIVLNLLTISGFRKLLIPLMDDTGIVQKVIRMIVNDDGNGSETLPDEKMMVTLDYPNKGNRSWWKLLTNVVCCGIPRNYFTEGHKKYKQGIICLTVKSQQE